MPAHALVCVCVSKTGFKLCTFLLLVDFGRLVNFCPNVYNASCVPGKKVSLPIFIGYIVVFWLPLVKILIRHTISSGVFYEHGQNTVYILCVNCFYFLPHRSSVYYSNRELRVYRGTVIINYRTYIVIFYSPFVVRKCPSTVYLSRYTPIMIRTRSTFRTEDGFMSLYGCVFVLFRQRLFSYKSPMYLVELGTNVPCCRFYDFANRVNRAP